MTEIGFFGGFFIKAQGKCLTDGDVRVKQVWILLEYLIANRQQDIPQEKLIDILWQDGECGNPLNALKNLVYRARKMLRPLQPEKSSDYILFRNGNYAWNSGIPCTVDIEEFERACRDASREDAPAEGRIADYRKAVGLYKGGFLPRNSGDDWAVMKNTYFCQKYIGAVQAMADLYGGMEKYDAAIAVCEAAQSVDPFDESLQETLIRSYVKAGYRSKALSHYEYISNLYYDKLGVRLSENIRSYMKETMKSLGGTETDLDAIKSDLNETGKVENAYYCDYEVFKNIYRIQARLSGRQGQPVFVALLTVMSTGPKSSDVTQRNPHVAAAMQGLQSVIQQSLRKSDVFSRYSTAQYVVMLPALTYENGQMVLRRILKKFGERNRYPDIIVGTKLNPLEPVA